MMENSAFKSETSSSLYSEALPGASLMVDGYLRGTCVSNSRKNHADPFRGPAQMAFLNENTHSGNDHDRYTENITIGRKNQNATSNMREYNAQYNGLTIIPWEDFVSNPRQLSDLFHLEKTGFITFDPDEVNVFFHATRMNKPPLGEISENGGAWVLTVENASQLEMIRLSLTESISVFGLTLVRKGKQFKQKQRAPCLLMLDPNDCLIGEQLNANFMRCSKIMESQGKFCLEINFNGSVERWCRKITSTRCESVGAKILITNGDEPDTLRTVENILCCIACFPIWAIQTALIKLHREVAYQDISMALNAEEIILHGSVGGIENQRKQLFRERPHSTVFYTKSMESRADDQGHKYICIKKYDKQFADVSGECTSRENQYETTSVYRLFEDKHKDTSCRNVRKENHIGMMDSNKKQGQQNCADNDRKQHQQNWSMNNDWEQNHNNWCVDNERKPDHKNLCVDNGREHDHKNQSSTHVENTVANIHIEQGMNVKYIESDCENDDDLLISHIHEPIKQMRLHEYEQINSNDENEDRKNHSEYGKSTTGSVTKSGFVDDTSSESSWIQDPSSENGNLNSKEIGRKEMNVTDADQFETLSDSSGNIPSNIKFQASELDVSSNNFTDDDIEVSDLEYDNTTKTEITSNNDTRQSHRHSVQKRKIPRHDSTRKYISAHTPRRNPKTAFFQTQML